MIFITALNAAVTVCFLALTSNGFYLQITLPQKCIVKQSSIHHQKYHNNNSYNNRLYLSTYNDDDDDDDNEGYNFNNKSQQEHVTLDNEEPLSLMFRRAVVLHRAGELQEALEIYELFLKAAKQFDTITPKMYAEIYVNMGAIQLKQGKLHQAKTSFQTALSHRSTFMGTAHVNLALLLLKEGSQSSKTASPIVSSLSDTMSILQQAKGHCEQAIDSNDDLRSVTVAKKLLNDIEIMIQKVQKGRT